jgi:hypothetical protein
MSAPMSAAMPAPMSAPASDAAAASAGPRLVSIRLADHPGKTRLVLETSAAMSYSADLDNDEKILTLVFDKGASDPALANLPLRSRLIKSVNFTPQSNGGFVAAITLNKGSRMLDQGQLPPGAVSPNHRIFIDLAS